MSSEGSGASHRKSCGPSGLSRGTASAQAWQCHSPASPASCLITKTHRFIVHSGPAECSTLFWNPVTYGGHQPHVATEDLKHGWSRLRCAVSVKYPPDFKELLGKGCKISR